MSPTDVSNNTDIAKQEACVDSGASCRLASYRLAAKTHSVPDAMVDPWILTDVRSPTLLRAGNFQEEARR